MTTEISVMYGSEKVKVLNFFYENHGDQRVFFNLKSSMSYLAVSVAFEYVCYGSTVIRNSFTLTARRSTSDVKI